MVMNGDHMDNFIQNLEASLHKGFIDQRFKNPEAISLSS